MKKIIILAVVIGAALFFAFFYQLKAIGFLESDAYAIVDNALVQNLKSSEPDSEKSILQPVLLEEMAPLYSRGGSVFVGGDKIKLNPAYPLFVNNATALLNLNNSAKLVSDVFSKVETYNGLYVSDGTTFNADRSQADPDTFILLELSNRTYINTQKIMIGSKEIPINSILNFADDSISFYSLIDNEFVYKRYDGLGDKTILNFRSRSYNYHDLLRALGLLTDPTIRNKPVPEEESSSSPAPVSNPDQLAIRDISSDLTEQEKKEMGNFTPAVKDTDKILPHEKSGYRKPAVNLSEFKPNMNNMSASGMLSLYDPSGAITSPIVITIRGPIKHGKNRYYDEWTFYDYDFATDEVLGETVEFFYLEENDRYFVYGTYTYLDEDGVEQTQRFGVHSFVMKGKRTDGDDGKKIGTGDGYVKPVVTCDQFTAGVYRLYSNLKIYDPAGRIITGVRFEVSRQNSVYMRRYILTSGDFYIGSLPPDETYEIIGFFEYKNENNVTVREEILKQTIKTLDLSHLEPMSLSFENGDLFHNKIQIKNIAFDPVQGKDTVQYVSAVNIAFNNGEFALSPKFLPILRAFNPVDYESTATLDALTSYPFELKCYDQFGNLLPLVARAEGTAKTCMAPPEAEIKVKRNFVADVEIDVTLLNKHFAAMRNPVFQVYTKINGVDTVISTTATINGTPSGSAISHELPNAVGTPTTIRFENLPLNKACTIVVLCDYDIEDDKGWHLAQEIGRQIFTTASIDTLGALIFNTSNLVPDDVKASMDLKLDTISTNPDLIAFISQVSVNAYLNDIEGGTGVASTPSATYTFNKGDPAFDNLMNGNLHNVVLDGLKSKSYFRLEISAEAKIGEDVYKVRTVNNVNSFRTLKLKPVCEFDTWFPTTHNIYLGNVIVKDPDQVIMNGVLMVLVDSSGTVVASKTLLISDLNKTIPLIEFSNLEADQSYNLDFYAIEYNQAYDLSTYKTNEHIDGPFFLRTIDSVSGKLSLLGSSENGSGGFDVRMRVQLEDLMNDLASEPQYTLKVYKEYYNGFRLQDDRNKVVPFTPGGNSTHIDHNDDNGLAPFISADSRGSYRVELWVTYMGVEIKLSEVEFNTNSRLIGLRTLADFSQLNTNPSGNFVLLNDIENRTSSWNSDAIPFSGTLDFQGYKMTMYDNSSCRLIYRTTGTAVVKNVVLDVYQQHQLRSDYRAYVVYNNYGTISNVRINLKECSKQLHVTWGLVSYANQRSGIIENFVINLETEVYIRSNFGGVAYSNSGIVRNGYVYGADIVMPDIYVETAFTSENIGGVVGVNNSGGQVSNVYSLVNIRNDYRTTSAANPNAGGWRYGTVVGYNSGLAENVYTTKEVTVRTYGDTENNNLRMRGPAVGDLGTGGFTRAFYVNDKTYSVGYTGAAANTKVSPDALHDYAWQTTVLGKRFDVNMARIGYFPHLYMPECMPSQDLIKLPESTANQIDLLHMVIEEQTEDYAKAVFSFKNPSYAKITGITIDGIYKVVLNTATQFNKDGISRLQVTLSQPTSFFSKYNVMGFTYTSGAGAGTKTYVSGERVIFAEFFKPVTTTAEWTAMNADNLARTQNYRLKSDLDFSNPLVAPSQILIGPGSGVNMFSGKLDGGIYDSDYNLIGMHKISNIVVSGASTAAGGVFGYVSGTITNLRAENLEMINPKDANVGFIRRLETGAVINNVHIYNIEAQGSTYIGGLVAWGQYGRIRNCSVTDVRIKDVGYTVYAGGLAGYLNATSIQNTYSRDVDLQISIAQRAQGVGGLVGQYLNSTIDNAYAHGKIKTSDQNAGGLVGVMGSAVPLKNVWTYVDVVSSIDNLGGLVGAYLASPVSIPDMSSLVLGEIYSSNKSSSLVKRAVGNYGDYTDSSNAKIKEIAGVYAWERQLVNSVIDTNRTDGTDLLTSAQLHNPDTYSELIGMGRFFNYQDVSDGVGYLPRILHTDGYLLNDPAQNENGQAQIALPGDRFSIESVEVQEISSVTYIKAVVNHPAGAVIENLSIEYMQVTPFLVESYSSTQSAITVTVDVFERFLDTYTLNGVYYQGSSTPAPALFQILMTSEPYNEIPNAARWVEIMSTRKDSYENFRLTGDIDFGTVALDSIIIDVKINRLDGGGFKIKNLGTAAVPFVLTDIGMGLVNTVNTEIKDVKFEDVHLVQNIAGGLSSGVVAKCMGQMNNLSFENCTYSSGKNTSGTALTGATNAGMIGWMNGGLKNITLKNVNVNSLNGDNIGGLIGFATDSEIENITAEQVTVNGRNYVGSVCGQFNRGNALDCTADAVTITSNGNYVGGLIGRSSAIYTNYNTNLPENNINLRSKVTNSKITGVSYVGGVFGQAIVRAFKREDGVLSQNNTVVGTGNYTGGIFGNNYTTYSYYGETRDCKIFGSMYVGGIRGDGNIAGHMYVLDSTISTIYSDYYYDEFNTKALVSDEATQNRRIGGISGTYRTHQNAVVNCKIGDLTADEVGGALGRGSIDCAYVTVFDTTVKGRNNVGGIVGYHAGGNRVYVTSNNATITASGQNAGGVIGASFLSKNLNGNSTGFINNSIFAGTVEGMDCVGGLLGLADGDMFEGTTIDYRFRNNFMLGSVKVTGVDATRGSLIANLRPGDPIDFTRTRVYEGSLLMIMNQPGRLAREIYPIALNRNVTPKTADNGTQSEKNITVSTEDLTTQITYTDLANYMSTSYFIHTPITQTTGNGPYLPFVRQSGGTAINRLRYTEGYSNAGAHEYYDDNNDNYPTTYRGGIKIPTGDISPFSLIGLALFQADVPQQLPVADVYAAGGAGRLNIDFDYVNDQAYFKVTADGQDLFGSQIEKRTYTVNYDFTTPITVVVGDGFNEVVYEVNPRELRRSVMVWKDEYYYITNIGVQSGNGKLLPGSYINLRDGEALSSDGTLYSLASGNPTDSVRLSLCDETFPLYSFNRDGYHLETFKNYTLSSPDVAQDFQLFVKNGTLSALDPNLPIVYDGVIVDHQEDGDYLTVLGADGVLTDTKHTIKTPDRFNNYGIAHISNTLGSDRPIVLVRYADGKVTGFNYLTGEVLTLPGGSGGSSSLIEYAKDFFTGRASSTLSGLAQGYLELIQLEELLKVGGLPDEILPGASASSANSTAKGKGGASASASASASDAEQAGGDSGESSGKSAGNANTPASSSDAGESAQPDDPTDVTDDLGNDSGVSGSIEGSQNSAGTLSGSNQGKESDPDSQAGNGLGAGESSAESGVKSDREQTSRDAGSEKPAGSSEAGKEDLLRPKYEPRAVLVPIFNTKTGQYELYDADALLSVNNANPKLALDSNLRNAVLTAIDTGQPKETDTAGNTAFPAASGVVLLILVFGVILFLLLYIIDRKRMM